MVSGNKLCRRFYNLPLNRLYNKKLKTLDKAFSNEHAAWERTLLFLGWSQYNLNLENEKDGQD